MPSIVTHHLFSEDIRLKTKENIQNALNDSLEIYHIFAQSFDNLFYYNLLTIKKGKEIRQFGNNAQRQKTQAYFKNIILEIKEKKLQKNTDVLAYLYGSLTHYILDSNCHPFVIYHAGWIDKQNRNYQYRGNHEQIEVNIDAVLYEEQRKLPLYQAKLGDILLPRIKFTKTLKQVINTVFQKTFSKENMASIYEKSTNQGHYILKYLVTDRYGIKKKSYQLFDALFQKNTTKYQNLSFYIKNPDIELLNRKHQIWYNPVNNQLKSTESFDDLYNKSLKEALLIFDLTDKVLQDKITLEDYLTVLQNKSYTTGLDCNLKENFRYFKN
ncbi:MAG: hypothetical protein HFI09_00535 [Bacilli bacterium]|nr:hypothetical protein [Bacilli bacterium]